MFKIEETPKYKIIVIFGIKITFKKKRNTIETSNRTFDLNSGERQISEKIEGIRKDHIVRYELAYTFLQNKFGDKPICGADIFCGNGYGSYLVASNLKNTTLLSIDASKGAIELAKKHYQFRNKIKYKNKFFPFKLPKKQFNFVISLESIEHIKDDIKFMETLVGSIKNSGYLILSTPNDEKLSFDKNVKQFKFHTKHYSHEDIQKLFIKYNLEVIEKYGQDTYIVNDSGIVKGKLEENKMHLIKDYEGQFNIFILKVNKY